MYRIEGYSTLIAACAPIARMFFKFEVDEPQEDPSSPTNFSPRPISLGRLEQSVRNSGFDRIESTETLKTGIDDRSMNSAAELESQGGPDGASERERCDKPASDRKMMHAMRNSISGWRRKDSWGWYEH
jgi:hypothetical protein